MKGKTRLGDLIIVAVIAITSLVPFFFFGRGERAVIYLDGKEFACLDLSSETEITVNGTVIKVEDGNIFFAESDCPDKVCVNTGKLNKKGSVAACVPNGVTLVIENKISETDGVTW